jgi:hypothetical protein
MLFQDSLEAADLELAGLSGADKAPWQENAALQRNENSSRSAAAKFPM